MLLLSEFLLSEWPGSGAIALQFLEKKLLDLLLKYIEIKNLEEFMQYLINIIGAFVTTKMREKNSEDYSYDGEITNSMIIP